MTYLEEVFNYLKRTSPAQTEFYQAAEVSFIFIATTIKKNIPK